MQLDVGAGDLERLDDAESRRLLAGAEVGRVGISLGALPAIVPVNYRLVDGAIVFRSAAGAKLAAATAGAIVAFEVDDFELNDRSGWSVLVIGKAEVVDDPAVLAAAEAAGLRPLVDGDRRSVIRIEPTLLSGRRVVHDAGSSWRA